MYTYMVPRTFSFSQTQGMQAIHKAAEVGAIEVLQTLMEYKADVNAFEPKNGHTSLSIGELFGAYPRIFELSLTNPYSHLSIHMEAFIAFLICRHDFLVLSLSLHLNEHSFSPLCSRSQLQWSC